MHYQVELKGSFFITVLADTPDEAYEEAIIQLIRYDPYGAFLESGDTEIEEVD